MSTSEVNGFVAEPHRDGFYLVSPATMKKGEVTCYNPSGFSVPWKMKAGGVFFPSESGDLYCEKASIKAHEYADLKNNKT